MKIAIFNHPFFDFYSSVNRVDDGILYYLQNIISPYQSICFNVVKNYKKKINLPQQLSYLNDYLFNDLTGYSFFSNYYQFGSPDNFNHKIFFDFNPDIILITSFAYCYFDGFKLMVNYLRKIKKDLIIIAGGNGPSSSPHYYILNSNIDYLVVGPAEISLKQLLVNIETKKCPEIFNVFSKSNYNNTNLINLNFNYKFIPYIYKKNNKIKFQLTRGCPKKCYYCSIHLNGNLYLKSDIHDIENELIKITSRNKINNNKIIIDFEDDNISIDNDYFIKVIEIIKKFFPDSELYAENGIDWHTLNFNLIDFLIKNNFKQFNFSLCSISKEQLLNINRFSDLDKFNNILNYIRDKNIKTIVYLISGFPDDDEDNILNTLLYLYQKNVIIGLSNFYPVPNTKIIEKIDKDLNPILCKATSFYQWGNLNSKKLITFFMISRFLNSLKKIKNNFTTDDKDITKIGLNYSLKNKSIFGIINNNNNILFKKYNLCDDILKKFFLRLNEIN